MSMALVRRAVAAGRRFVTLAASTTDSFGRADSATTLGTSDSGLVWAALSGTWGISANEAYQPVGSGGIAALPVGSSDQVVRAKLALLNNAPGVVARVSAADTFYLADVAGGTVRLFKCVAGAFTSLGTGGSGTAGDVLTLTVAGTAISVKKNGVLVASATDTSVATGASAGMRAGTDLDRLDDFSVIAVTNNVSDSFNRSDNASSLGITDSGQGWVVSGTWGISTNQAYKAVTSGSNNDSAVVESLLSDCTVSVIRIEGTNGAGEGLAVRQTTPGNFIGISRDQVLTVTAFSKSALALFPTFVTGDTMVVVLSGSTITVKDGTGTVKASVTTTFNQTATLHGLYQDQNLTGNTRFDNFEVKP